MEVGGFGYCSLPFSPVLLESAVLKQVKIAPGLKAHKYSVRLGNRG